MKFLLICLLWERKFVDLKFLAYHIYIEPWPSSTLKLSKKKTHGFHLLCLLSRISRRFDFNQKGNQKMQENCALNQMEKKMVYQRFEELTTIRFNTSVLLLLMIINLHLENLDVFVCHLYAFARMNVRCLKGERKKTPNRENIKSRWMCKTHLRIGNRYFGCIFFIRNFHSISFLIERMQWSDIIHTL